MANRERGEVDLALGGRTYTLRLSLNALCRLQDVLATNGEPLRFEDLATRMAKPDVPDMVAVFWASLQEFHAEEFPTPADAGERIGVSDIPKLLPALSGLLSIDRPERGTRPQPARAKRGRGGPSTSGPGRSA